MIGAQITAIIASYNRAEHTLEMLRQLGQQTLQPNAVVLVDDASSDGTVDQVQAKFPSTRIVCGPGDWFWCRSMHMGVREALKNAGPNDYFLMLNDDLQIKPDFIEQLVIAAKANPGCAIHAANAPIENTDVIQFGGVKMNWVKINAASINKGRRFSEFDVGHCEPTDVVWGRGLLVPVEAVLKAGNYSWRIPHRGDREFGFRLARHGFSLYIAYDAVAYTHDDELDASWTHPEYRWQDCWNFFFGVRSHGSLRTAFWTAMGSSAAWGYRSYFFLVTACRLVGHFLTHVHVRPKVRRTDW
jgi:GT2 family glycosyltransferase